MELTLRAECWTKFCTLHTHLEFNNTLTRRTSRRRLGNF